jgi:hypothetical protein
MFLEFPLFSKNVAGFLIHFVCRVSFLVKLSAGFHTFLQGFSFILKQHTGFHSCCVCRFSFIFQTIFAGFRAELLDHLFRPAASVSSLPRIAAEFADFFRGSGWRGRGSSDGGCRYPAQYLGPHSGGVEDQAPELLSGQFQVFGTPSFKI